MDIVVTIPKSEYFNDDTESSFLKDHAEYHQFWTLARQPQKLLTGDKVYFVKNDRVDSCMTVVNCSWGEEGCDVTGRVWTGFIIDMVNPIKAPVDIKTKGFQGFRYKWW